MAAVELISEVESDLLCPICLHLLREPVELNECEHVFCRACIEEAVAGNVCPVCQDPTSEKSIRRAHRFVINRVDAVQVRCPNGCGNGIAFGRLKTHVDEECEQRMIPCPDDCGSRVKASDVSAHREACPCRKEVCEIVDGGLGCGAVLFAKDLKAHHCLASIRQTLSDMTLGRERVEQQVVAALAKSNDDHEERCKSLEQAINDLTRYCKTHEERVETELNSTVHAIQTVESEMHEIRARLLRVEKILRPSSQMKLRPFGEEDRSLLDPEWVLSRIDRPNTILLEAIQEIFLNPKLPENWNLLITLDSEVQSFVPGGTLAGGRLMLTSVVAPDGHHRACVVTRGFTFDGHHWVSQNASQVLESLFRSISVIIDSLAKRILDVSLVAKYNKLRESLALDGRQIPLDVSLNVIKAFTTWNYSRLLLHESMAREERAMLDAEAILGPEPC